MNNDSWDDIFTMDENVHEGWNYYEWKKAEEYPKYRYYRFHGTKQGACAINEITLTGVETIDSMHDLFTCAVNLITGETKTELNTLDYLDQVTPVIDSLSPRYGSVEGGTEITFKGSNLYSDPSAYAIIIDGISCAVTVASYDTVKCTTGPRPGLPEPSMVIKEDRIGNVAHNGVVFTYVSMWSADSTWGGEYAPMHHESIHVPKGLNLMVDVDSTPELMAVLVEGSIIFAPDADPNHHRTFDARYMLINGGLMEVGTVEFPYTSKITITMHGSVTDPYLPIYGNKVIGVRKGTLDMHGPVRTPVWTMLETTAEKGSKVITVQEPVDW